MHDCWIAFPQNNLQCNFTPLFHKTLFSFSSFTINVIQSDQLRNFLDLILVEFYIKNKSESTKSKPINLKNYIAQIKLIFFEKQIKNNIHYGFINQFKLKKKEQDNNQHNYLPIMMFERARSSEPQQENEGERIHGRGDGAVKSNRLH